MSPNVPTRRRCSYEHHDWHCPFDAEDAHDLCIFHLPVDKKKAEDFWSHLNLYLNVAYSGASGDEATTFWTQGHSWASPVPMHHPEMAPYKNKKLNRLPWRFTGFIFPEMDQRHDFRAFVFRACDFSEATFGGHAAFAETRFLGSARFVNAKFMAKGDFGSSHFTEDAFFMESEFHGDANFSQTEFLGKAQFWLALFKGRADLSDGRGGTATGPADFAGGLFEGVADISRRKFGGTANYARATFKELAIFDGAEFHNDAQFVEGATFERKARFDDATFGRRADFSDAEFRGDVSFRDTVLRGELRLDRAILRGRLTSFHDTDFSGQVSFRRASVSSILVLRYAHLRNQVLFDGTVLDTNARVLLWGLNFVHGTSDIRLDKRGHRGQRTSPNGTTAEQDVWRGSLIEPAGQVVFRDIGAGMNRVSFLHTDILTDRLLVRFSNVKWEIAPREFLLDAAFAFEKDPDRWADRTGLPQEEIDSLPELFFADCPEPRRETDGLAQNRRGSALRECAPLVRQDVERIAREIRLSYEKYGHYGDAGDYYVAEMDFRRVRTPLFRLRFPELAGERRWPVRIWHAATGFLSSLTYRTALELYRLFSLYGESPGRALTSLLSTLVGFGIIFVIAGFWFMGRAVDRNLWPPVWSEFSATTSDVWLAIRMALANLMPGNLRGDVLGIALTSEATKTWAVFQVIMTYILLTLLLLAIRRRFRR